MRDSLDLTGLISSIESTNFKHQYSMPFGYPRKDTSIRPSSVWLRCIVKLEKSLNSSMT